MSLNIDIPSESGNQSSVEYIPTPIPKKRPSSLMNALEELNGGYSALSYMKKRRIKTKIPKVAHLNPSRSLGGQKEFEITRNNHKSVPSGNRVCPRAVASKQNSSVPIQRTTPKVVVPAQKARNTSAQGIASKHKTLQSSTSSLVNTNHFADPGSFNSSHSLVPPVTLSKGPMLSKRTSATPVQYRSNNSLKPVQPSSAPSKSHSLDLKTARSLTRPSSQPLSSSYGCGSRSLGIAAQLGLAQSRIESGSLLQSHIKTSNNSIHSIPKPIPFSNGNSSLRPAELPSNGQKKPPARTEPSIQQPRLQPRMTMERSCAVVPALRGIAAQYGSLPVAVGGRSPTAYLDDESDKYASDDSFIDDTDCTSAKDYLRAVKDIHKSLHFDPNKYAKISKYDDLASMESSYRQIEKEEKLRYVAIS